MSDSSFSFTPFDFNGIYGSYGRVEDFEKDQTVFKVKQDHLFEVEDFGGTHPFPAECGFYEESIANKGADPMLNDQLQLHQHQQPNSFQFSTVFPPTQPIQESTKLPNSPTRGLEILENDTKMQQQAPLFASFELLRNYGNGFKKLKGERLSNTSTETETNVGSQRLSTEEIMRVAGSRYIEFSSNDDYYMPMHPFGFTLSGLSEDETKDVELTHLLLAEAEKVGYQQFDRASKVLLRCEWISSARANSVQRIVFHFAEALRKRIDKETGRMITLKELEQNDEIVLQKLSINSTLLTIHQKLPFSQVWLFTGVQAIIENVAMKSKVHFIDFGVRSGVQWTVLMQALAERKECRIEHLKITAVGSTSKEKIEEAGKRLASVAKSLNLPFSFKPVSVTDMKDIKEDLFEIEEDEAVVIYASFVLRTMISTPNYLENLMRVIRNLKPSLMIVTEVEANLNSPSFVNRFIESLFYYSAYYDCVETCMMTQNDERMGMEAILRDRIRNIVVEEGGERTTRSVKMDVWRAFFTRFGMVEIGLSESSLYQASLVVKQFGCSSFCTLDKNGECLTARWKGTPIHSLSAWKFH